MALKFLISVLTIKVHPFSTYAIFRKTNISFLLLHTHTCTYHGIRNVSFSEHFAYLLNPICPRGRGTHCAPPVGILTAVFSPVALWSSFYMTFSLILYWKCNQQNFFWSVEWFAHTGLFVGDRQRLSLIVELSIHYYTALVSEIACKFGCLIAT